MVSFSLKLVVYVCWLGFADAALYQIRLTQVMFHDTSWAPKVSLRSHCSKDMGLEILTCEIRITPRQTHMCIYIYIYIHISCYIYIYRQGYQCMYKYMYNRVNQPHTWETKNADVHHTRMKASDLGRSSALFQVWGGGIPNGSAPNSNGPRSIFRSLPLAWKNTQESELKTYRHGKWIPELAAGYAYRLHPFYSLWLLTMLWFAVWPWSWRTLSGTPGPQLWDIHYPCWDILPTLTHKNYPVMQSKNTSISWHGPLKIKPLMFSG